MVGGLPPPPLLMNPAMAHPSVQFDCHTGLTPLAAKVNGKPMPPGNGTHAPVRDATLVSAPVCGFTANAVRPPTASMAYVKLPCG